MIPAQITGGNELAVTIQYANATGTDFNETMILKEQCHTATFETGTVGALVLDEKNNIQFIERNKDVIRSNHRIE